MNSLKLAGFLSVLCSCTMLQKHKKKNNFPDNTGEKILLKPRQLTAGNESNFAPSLSPDGRSVIFVSDKKGNLDLWVKKTTGGFIRPLTIHTSDDLSPVFSPDGDRLAFVSRRSDAVGDILLLDPSGKASDDKKSRIIKHPGFEDMYPSWFPDGGHIVFASRKPGEGTPSLMLADTDTLEVKPLEDVAGNQPFVFPDSRKVVFVYKGSLQVYDMKARSRIALTEGGKVQDGSPWISPDGKSLLFIRYLDDTNEDGIFNADDRPTLWQLRPETQSAQGLKENFTLLPLTSAAFAAYYPRLQDGRLYFTLQNGKSLDLYYLPEYGQIPLPSDLEEMSSVLQLLEHPDDQIYLLRRSAAGFFRAGLLREASEAALAELRLQAERGKAPEARWLRKKILDNFSSDSGVVALADLAVLGLDLTKWKMGGKLRQSGGTGPLTDMERQLENIAEQAGKKGQLRVVGEARLLQARILSETDRLFEAAKVLQDTEENFGNFPGIAARALLQNGLIQPQLSGKDVATGLLTGLIRKYPDQYKTVVAAATQIVDMTADTSRPVAALHLLRERSMDLRVLPAMAHLRIGAIFSEEGKDIVAANEYRVMVELYPTAPVVLLTAAERLTGILLKRGEPGEAAKVLRRLREHLRGHPVQLRQKAEILLSDVLGREAESLIREKRWAEAESNYEEMLSFNPGSYGAYKGLVRISAETGKLAEELPAWKQAAEVENPDPVHLFRYGLAVSWQADSGAGPGTNLEILDESTRLLERVRNQDDQITQVHQALGWLYQQKAWWRKEYEKRGGFASFLGEGWNTVGLGSLAEIIFDWQVLNFFREDPPDYLELSIDSWLAARSLARPGSVERVQVSQNLAHASYEKDLFQKALHYYIERIQALESLPVTPLKSEALLWQRAGRSAFQTGEGKLAITLQKQALSRWKQAGEEEQVLKAMDALALSLWSEEFYEEALEQYSALVSALKAKKRERNLVRVYLNRSRCFEKLGQPDQALAEAGSAEALLKKLPGKHPFVFDSGLIIETIRSAVWRKAGRKTAWQQSLRKKTDILLQKKQTGQEELGKGKEYLAHELALAYNQSGFLYLSRGLTNRARESFSKALQYADLLYKDHKKPAPPVRTANLLNLIRTQLRLIAAGGGEPGEVRELLVKLRYERKLWLPEKTAEQSEGRDNGPGDQESPPAERARGAGTADTGQTRQDEKSTVAPAEAAKDRYAKLPDYIPEMLALEGMLSLWIHSEQKKLPEGKEGTLVAELSSDTGSRVLRQSMHLAAAKSLPAARLMEPRLALTSESLPEGGAQSGLLALFKKIRHDSGGNSLDYWKFLGGRELWDEAFREASHYIKNGGIIRSHSDRLLLRRIFEGLISGAGEEKPGQVFGNYMRIRMLEMLNRNFPEHQFKNQAWKEELILEKSTDSLRSHLQKGDAVLAVHRLMNAPRVLLHWTDREKDLVWFEESTDHDPGALLRSAGFRRSTDPLIAGVKHLYLVPSDELFDAPWELLTKERKGLSLSFLPARDSLPVALSRRPAPWQILTYDTSSDKKKPDEELLRIHALPEDPSQVRHYLGISSLFVSDRPLVLNQTHGSQTFWLPAPPDSRTVFRVGAGDFGSMPLERNRALAFSRVSWIEDTGLDFRLTEGWQTLWFSVFAAGGRSVLLPVPGVAESGLGKVTGLSSGNVSGWISGGGVSARVLGAIPAELPEDEWEEHWESLLEEAEEAQDENDWKSAAGLLTEALYYGRLAGYSEDNRETLRQLALVFYRMGHHREALVVQNVVISQLLLDEEATEETGAALMMGANFAHLAKQYSESEKLMARAEKIFKEEENLQSQARIWHLRGVNADKQKKYLKAIEYYNKSGLLHEEDDDQVQVAARLREAGTVWQLRLNKYEKALHYFSKAAALLEEEEETSALAAVNIEQANTYNDMGQPGEAISILTGAMDLVDEEEPVLWIRLRQNLAIGYFRSGMKAKASEVLARVSDAVKKLPETDAGSRKRKQGLKTDILNLKGMIQAKKGLFGGAFALFDQALELARKNSDSGREAYLLNNYGFWLRESGNTEESLSYFQESWKIDRQKNIKKDIAFDLRNLGLSEVSLGHLKSAREHLLESLKISQDLGILFNLIYCHLGLGDLFLREKEYPAAQKHYKKAASLAASAGLEDFMWKSVAAGGIALKASGKPEEAEKVLQKAIALIESFNPGLSSRSSASGLSSERGVQEVYDELVVTLATNGRPEEALLVSEKSKNRLLVDGLGYLDLPFFRGESRALVKKLKSGLSRLQLLNIRLRRNEGAGEGGKEEVRTQFQSLKKEIARGFQKLKSSDPQAFSLFRVRMNKSHIKSVQKNLPEGAVTLAYHVTRQTLFIWVLSGTATKMVTVPLARRALERKLADYQMILENYSAPGYLSQELYNLLIKPVEQSLSGATLIGLVPHRWLQQLSFASLHDGESFLIDKAGIFYLETFAELKNVAKHPHSWTGGGRKILALVNPDLNGLPPLPFAEKEAASIQRSFPATTVFAGNNATRARISPKNLNADVLHIATHGSFDGNDPAHSALFFSGPAGEPEAVRASELFAYEPAPYLVTLSACESGRGNLNNGEPFLSLSRGFFYSGARSLLSSLWRIDDVASAVLMKRFYRYLSRGRPLYEALRESQLVVRKHFPHPVYWASFRLTGSYH